jgi:VCBS repeat-containing protein
LQRGMKVFVQEGTQEDEEWVIASDEPDIGTDDIEFSLYLSVDIAGVSTAAATSAAASAAAAAASAASAASSTPTYSTRAALAASTVPSSVVATTVLGYATAGDSDAFTLKRAASQPRYGGVRSTDRYLPNGLTDNTNGGWWVYVPAPTGVDARAFGYKPDWNGVDAGATDNTAALQEAINFASLSFGTGFDTGGGGGSDVLLPVGTAMFATGLTVHDGVRVLGKGTYGTVLKMKDTFSTSANFIRLGTAGDASGIAATQVLASAGDLVINGTWASGGVAYLLQKRQPSIYSVGNDSARTFTVYGTDETGASISASVAGTNGGRADVPDYFMTITRVAVNGAVASTVTVGTETVAAFGSRLEQLQLFSALTNAVSGSCMVYTNNAQHTAGLKNVKIFGGNRHCAKFETGIGGASYFVFEDVETFNQGNLAGVASNNSQILFNYAGLLMPCRNIVMAGPGTSGGAAAVGMEILGGFVVGENIHPEGIATGIKVDIANENLGNVNFRGIFGGNSMDQMIWLTSVVDNNSIVLEACYPNGATVTVKDDPAAGTVTGNIRMPTLF